MFPFFSTVVVCDNQSQQLDTFLTLKCHQSHCGHFPHANYTARLVFTKTVEFRGHVWPINHCQ